MDDNNTKKLPAAAVINGGLPFSVRKLDGTTEEVTVRIVPLSKVLQYASKIDTICELVELVCDKPAGWTDTLNPEDALALDKAARDLNDPIMGRVANRQHQVAGRIVEMSKGIGELMKSLPTQ